MLLRRSPFKKHAKNALCTEYVNPALSIGQAIVSAFSNIWHYLARDYCCPVLYRCATNVDRIPAVFLVSIVLPLLLSRGNRKEANLFMLTGVPVAHRYCTVTVYCVLFENATFFVLSTAMARSVVNLGSFKV